MINVDALMQIHARDLQRITNMSKNIMTVNEIEFVYDQLMQMEPPLSNEILLATQALTSSLVVAYGRLFASQSGSRQLNPAKIPEHLCKAHKEIMDLRNEKHAHHGNHHSFSSNTRLTTDQNVVYVHLQFENSMYVGASLAWRPLFIWLREHIYECVQRDLLKISEKSGIKWMLPEGPTPVWAQNNEP